MSRDRPHSIPRPYRVMRRGDWAGPPLTPHQLRVLTALVTLSSTSRGDIEARAVAQLTGIRLGSVVVILQSLTKRRLVIRHPGLTPDEADAWRPTLMGYARVRHFRGSASQQRCADRASGSSTPRGGDVPATGARGPERGRSPADPPRPADADGRPPGARDR